MRRTCLGVVTVAAMVLTGVAGAAHAAPSRTLYFDNWGSTGSTGCTATYVLTMQTPHGNPCHGVMVVAAGEGYTYRDSYQTTTPPRFRLDARRPVVGTVYLASYPYVNVNTGSGGVIPTLPGADGATITLIVNNATVGQASGTGVAAPGGAAAIPVRFTLPRGLDRATVYSLVVEVSYTSGAGVTSVSYAPASRSQLSFPVATR
jgi:hypothetical protein